MAFVWLLLLVVPFLLGLAIGRWGAMILPPVLWAAWFLGLNEGWWGNGVGDTWQLAMIFDGVAGAVCTVPGVMLHKVARHFQTRERHS